MKTFSIKETLRFGWTEFKKHPWRYVAITLIAMAISAISNVRYLGLVGLIAGVIVSIGSMKIMLNAVDGKKPEVEDLFSSWRLFFKYVGAMILLGLMIFVPVFIVAILFGAFAFASSFTLSGATAVPVALMVVMFAAIVFAVIIMIRYIFVLNLIVDGRAKVFDAFKMSSKMTKGYRGKIFLFGAACALLNLLGLIALVIGLFITSVVTKLAGAYLYRKLLAKYLETNPEATATVHAETMTTEPATAAEVTETPTTESAI